MCHKGEEEDGEWSSRNKAIIDSRICLQCATHNECLLVSMYLQQQPQQSRLAGQVGELIDCVKV